MTAIHCTCGRPGHEANLRKQLPAYIARRVMENKRLSDAVREAGITLAADRPGTTQFYRDTAALNAAMEDLRRTQT